MTNPSRRAFAECPALSVPDVTSGKRVLAELLTFVAGVLIALGVDQWRQERAAP